MSWRLPETVTGFGLVCQFSLACEAEAVTMVWILDPERDVWVASVLCLPHLAEVCQVPLEGAA
jgi:hypothetical protein